MPTPAPAELRADAVIVLDGQGRWPGRQPGKLAVVVEVQTSPDEGKRRVWPAYLALARAQHDCLAVLVVICPGRVTGRWARRPIPTGHPGFDLMPLVIDADTTPRPGVPGLAGAGPELAVLAAFTGAVDLEQDADRRLVLGCSPSAGRPLSPSSRSSESWRRERAPQRGGKPLIPPHVIVAADPFLVTAALSARLPRSGSLLSAD